MKYPCLVNKRYCKTDIHIEIEPDGLTKYGEPLPSVVFDGKCNYQDKAKTILTAEKKKMEVAGTALLPGDILPEFSVISNGKAIIAGSERRIVLGKKARNPDGTVNYTVLEMI